MPDWMWEALAEYHDREATKAAAEKDFETACWHQERAVTAMNVLNRRIRARNRVLRQVVRRRYVRAMNREARAAWLGQLVRTAERPRERRDQSGRSSAKSGDSPDDPAGDEPPAAREGGRP